MKRFAACCLCLVATACASADDASWPFTATPVAEFDEPWAMTFLPDGRLLVTEKEGRLLVVTQDGSKSAPLAGVPAVAYGGQGGLGDVVLHPGFAENGIVYLSYAEAGSGNARGAAVIRARLALDGSKGGALEDVEVI